MKTLRPVLLRARAARRGTALLLAFFLLLIVSFLVWSIGIETRTDAQLARNDLVLTSMDLAIESALLQQAETLKTDGESTGEADAGAPAGAGAAADPTAAGAGADPAAAAGGEGQAEASDSRRDTWSQPARSDINEIKLRVWAVDEDSKFNVLNLLASDEKEAEAAGERVVRILDLCREGTTSDIDRSTAEQMVKAMREHMTRRRDSALPRPKLLTDLEKNDDVGMPLSLREFAVLPPFDASHFQDYRDEHGLVVHSIDSFLTVWTSVGIAQSLPAGAVGAAGAGSVNAASAASSSSGSGAKSSTSGSASKSSSSSGKSSQSSGTSGTSSAQGSGTGAGGTGTGGGAAGAVGAAAGAAGAGPAGGYAVNVNTAPNCVLHALFDGRDVNPRVWDKIVEYRNLEEEDEDEKANEEETEEEPLLDEYGREIIKRQIFESISELAEVDGYSDLPGEIQQQLSQILTTKSNVFSIYVVARKATSMNADAEALLDPQELRRREEVAGDSLVRVVRSVVWRRKNGEDIEIRPIVRWEVLDYLPYEVLDFPDEER